MSHKQGVESQGNYMDGTHVKISEKYKPPPRINPVTTYAQRLSLNKQILDNLPDYDFTLEKNIIEKVKELKCARKAIADERKLRLEKIKEERKKREECLKKENESKVSESEKEVIILGNTNKSTNNVNNRNSEEVITNDQTYNTSSATCLLPTQALTNSYSNILTPIPLTNTVNQGYSCKSTDKSPFNISDFEADTSSPFDNMELKTLNDMEELAQVLKSDNKIISPQVYPNYNTVHSVTSHSNTNYVNYASPGNIYNMYQAPSTISSYLQQPNTSVYSHTNGYYYLPEANTSFATTYPTISAVNTVEQQGHLKIQGSKSSFRSVPDIIKALETELDNTHIDNTQNNNTKLINQPSRPKSTDSVCPKVKTKSTDVVDPFNLLSKDLQELATNISSMGFPLPMVARACKVLGADHKKVVEHLLAMTELMDLGFPEKEVSNALLQCNNDRDKALDKLIL